MDEHCLLGLERDSELAEACPVVGSQAEGSDTEDSEPVTLRDHVSQALAKGLSWRAPRLLEEV
jgi:hypothetical protein